MRVLVADDHQIVRYGIKILLQSKYIGVEFEECDNLSEVTDKVKNSDYDLLVLDIHMDETTSIQYVRNLVALKSKIKIIILSQLPEEIFGLHYIKAGAKAYVDKKKNFDLLSKAVDSVINGKVFITEEIRDEMFRLTVEDNATYSKLSEREMDVLACMLKGLPTSEIGIKLSLQNTTVSTYKNRIFEKLKTNNIVVLKELSMVLGLFADK